MHRSELIERVADRLGFPPEHIKDVVSTVFDEIMRGIERKESVAILGFGTFFERTLPPRKVYVPKKRETRNIPERRKFSFRPATGVPERLNQD